MRGARPLGPAKGPLDLSLIDPRPTKGRGENRRGPSLSWVPRGVGALAAGEPGFAAGFGERAHAPDIGRAFRHADDAAGIEKIEIVTRLQTLVIGGKRQPRTEQAFALLLRVGEMAEQNLGVGVLEIVSGIFALGLMEHLAIAE